MGCKTLIRALCCIVVERFFVIDRIEFLLTEDQKLYANFDVNFHCDGKRLVLNGDRGIMLS